MSETTPDLDILIRPGGNDRVIEKKVLLADLARQEAARLGIAPSASDVHELGAAFLREMGLLDDASTAAWLAQTGLSDADFKTVVTDLAAVLAVEAHYRERLAARIELHRRLMAGRTRRLAQTA
jgi:hypothetical protein